MRELNISGLIRPLCMVFSPSLLSYVAQQFNPDILMLFFSSPATHEESITDLVTAIHYMKQCHNNINMVSLS